MSGLWHWARKAYFPNPRRTNCYIDEDFVGRMKDVVHASSPGTDRHLMDRCRWGISFFLAEHQY